jgi:tRNA(Ile)-lysidine synthase
MMLQLNFIDELRACPQVFVACSGGLDSMVLTDLLHKNGVNLHVLHCNFGLRGKDSDDDEIFVEQFCESRNIPCKIKRFDTLSLKKNKEQSIQQLARDLRYAWFESVIESNPGALLCTAHQHDDDIEQVLLRLLSSGRILDMGGIAHSRDYIRRPLLEVKKSDLLQYAKKNNLTWREDSSNAEVNYTRNKIRLELIPLLKEIDPRYESALSRLAHEVKNLRVEAEVLIEKFFLNQTSRKEFLVTEEFWCKQLSLFKELFLESWKNSSAGVEELDKLLDSEPGKRVDFEDFYVLREKSGFWFGRHALDEVQRREIQLSDCELIQGYQRDKANSKCIHQLKGNEKICIDALSPGAELHYSNGQTRKVKKIFNDEKWSHHRRKKASGIFVDGCLVQLVDFGERGEVFFEIENNFYRIYFYV